MRDCDIIVGMPRGPVSSTVGFLLLVLMGNVRWIICLVAKDTPYCHNFIPSVASLL